MRVSEEPVCIYLFRQNPVFTFLHVVQPSDPHESQNSGALKAHSRAMEELWCSYGEKEVCRHYWTISHQIRFWICLPLLHGVQICLTAKWGCTLYSIDFVTAKLSFFQLILFSVIGIRNEVPVPISSCPDLVPFVFYFLFFLLKRGFRLVVSYPVGSVFVWAAGSGSEFWNYTLIS